MLAPYVCFMYVTEWPPIGEIAAHSAYDMFSWYQYLIVSLFFSHLGFWIGNFFLIAPFPDLCLLVPFFETSRRMGKPTICIGENKGADQLRGNREADQRLCFRLMDSTIPLLGFIRNFKLLAIFCDCTGRFMSGLVGNQIVDFLTHRLKLFECLKVKGNGQEMAQSKRNSHPKSRGGKKTKFTLT